VHAADLLDSARELLKVGRGAPRQANLRKACSAVYYALFHTVCATCAGALAARRTRRAWTQVYRAVEHRIAKDNCQRLRGMGFPAEIESFARLFVQMQEKRHRADYDPNVRFYKSAVEADIRTTAVTIAAFGACARTHRRAFAAYILLRGSRV
jgi:uncharacterized protein (UPF0332 family)